MRIVLTSFYESRKRPGRRFSVARWQPQGFNYPALDFLAPRDPDTGKKMVHLEPVVFLEKYLRVLEMNRGMLFEFLSNQARAREVVDTLGDLVLCCWCTPQRQAQYKRLYCHTVILGRYIEEIADHEVLYIDGRDRDWFADINLGGMVRQE